MPGYPGTGAVDNRPLEADAAVHETEEPTGRRQALWTPAFPSLDPLCTSFLSTHRSSCCWAYPVMTHGPHTKPYA